MLAPHELDEGQTVCRGSLVSLRAEGLFAAVDGLVVLGLSDLDLIEQAAMPCLVEFFLELLPCKHCYVLCR